MRLYLIPFLHQTTTSFRFFLSFRCCILFHFYIKPQHCVVPTFRSASCILFHFYIKPQQFPPILQYIQVVSYSISTSNHNHYYVKSKSNKLYLIPFLHQTTTRRLYKLPLSRCILFHFYIKPQLLRCWIMKAPGCILFHFYIKPQPKDKYGHLLQGCILFHFYIKPQPPNIRLSLQCVVSYSISTSNHNIRGKLFSNKTLYLIPFLHQTTTLSS